MMAWEKLRVHLQGPATTLQTERQGHAIELTADAIQGGASTIVAVGGDGTIHEVVNGFFQRDRLISDRAKLGILSHGTGSDFQKVLQLPLDEATAAARIERGVSRPVDLLKVRYTQPDGAWASRYSINITSFGMGGVVASRVKRYSRFLAGRMSFALATIQTAISFKGVRVAMRFDADKSVQARVTHVAVGNGRYHGGGMLACPLAVIDDGLFDATIVRYLRLPELIRNLSLLYNGKIYNHPKVQFLRASHLRAEADEPAFVEIDGEPLGRLPVEITVIPQAIRILA
jgi:YegS/Rv2252/BmrU family lipid kinase